MCVYIYIIAYQESLILCHKYTFFVIDTDHYLFMTTTNYIYIYIYKVVNQNVPKI